jgi:CheY-like chemotaxis protein
VTSVLVVDDDAGIRDVMRAILAHEDYAIYEAENGEVALAFCAAARPDVVLLDMMLPGMHGLEVLRALKADPATAAAKVVVITALGTSIREEALAAGADGFFAKPFSPTALIQAVEQALGSGGRAD